MKVQLVNGPLIAKTVDVPEATIRGGCFEVELPPTIVVTDPGGLPAVSKHLTAWYRLPHAGADYAVFAGY